jgi:hypothetical protein
VCKTDIQLTLGTACSVQSAYFNKNWRIELKTDVSPTGLSAILAQIKKVTV